MSNGIAEVMYLNEDRAGGIVRVEGRLPLTWTAIKSDGSWYVVLHAEWQGESSGLRAILQAVHNVLHRQIQAKAA